MFFDGDHLSAYGDMTLLPDFTAYMLPKLAKPAQKGPALIPPQGYAFNQEGVPDFLDSISGLSRPESWGRWSDGNLAPVVRLSFDKALPSSFTIEITAQAYGPNISKPVIVIVGNEQQSISVNGQPTLAKLHFVNVNKAKNIEIVPPYPKSPKESRESGDERLLGVGLVSIKIITD